MFGFIFSLLIGALAGSIAGRIMGSETSALRNIVLGILGSFLAASCSSKQSILKMPQLSGVKAVVFSFLTDVIFSRTML